MKKRAEVMKVSFNAASGLRPGDIVTDATLDKSVADGVAAGLDFFRVKLRTVVGVTHDVTEIEGAKSQEFFGRSALERVDVTGAAQGGAFELKTFNFANFGNPDAELGQAAAWWVVWRTED